MGLKDEKTPNDARRARMTPALYEIGVQELTHARHVQQVQTMMMARASMMRNVFCEAVL